MLQPAPLRKLQLVAVVVLAVTVASPLGTFVTAASGRPRNGADRADAAGVMRLSGHVLPVLAGAERLTTVGGADEPLTVTFVLAHDDQVAFDAQLRALHDPASPSYRHVLTQTEL